MIFICSSLIQYWDSSKKASDRGLSCYPCALHVLFTVDLFHQKSPNTELFWCPVLLSPYVDLKPQYCWFCCDTYCVKIGEEWEQEESFQRETQISTFTHMRGKKEKKRTKHKTVCSRISISFLKTNLIFRIRCKVSEVQTPEVMFTNQSLQQSWVCSTTISVSVVSFPLMGLKVKHTRTQIKRSIIQKKHKRNKGQKISYTP